MYIIRSGYLYYNTFNRFISDCLILLYIMFISFEATLYNAKCKKNQSCNFSKINPAISQGAVVNYLIALIMQSRLIYTRRSAASAEHVHY